MQRDSAHPARPAGDGTFLRELARELRNEHGDAAWDGKDDGEVLAPLVAPASDGEPDPDVFWRIELYFTAVGRAIEQAAGVPCRVMMRMHHEGHGIVVLLAGRLVVVRAALQDAHRFRFESLDHLARAGADLVEGGLLMIERFPEAARHAG
jgi:probable nitrogen fixation protein